MNIRAHISKAASFVLRASRLPFQQPTQSSRYKNIPFTSKGIHTLVAISLIATNFVGFIPTVRQRANDPDILKSMPHTFVSLKQEVTIPPRPTIDRPQPRMGIRPERGTYDLVKPIPNSNPPKEAAQGETHSQPIMFIENLGQFDPRSAFVVNGGSGIVQIATEGIWISKLEPPSDDAYQLPDSFENIEPAPTPSPGSNEEVSQNQLRKGVNLRVSFPGANPGAIIEGFNRLDTKVSYFKGANPDLWYSNIPVWGGIRYVDLYPGIDLEIDGSNGLWSWRLVLRDDALLEADIINLGGAREIKLRVEGADGLSSQDGVLNIQTGVGAILLPEPPLEAPNGLNRLSLEIPVQLNGDEIVLYTLKADPDTISLPGQYGSSPSIPSEITEQISSAQGQLFYSTYIGGSAADRIFGIDVNAWGEAYITGQVASTDFPTQAGLYNYGGGSSDVIVSRFSADGSRLIYSTYIGGSNTDCHWDCAIAVGPDGSAYVTGATQSTDFPTTGNAYDQVLNGTDAFVLRLSPAGTSLSYSTLFGGGSYEYGHGITVEGASDVYITGMTASTDLPTTPNVYDNQFDGFQDVFVAKFDTLSNGVNSLIYSTYIGGSNADQGHGIDVVNGMAFVTGQTLSSDFPTHNAYDSSANGSWDSFAFKLDQSASSLVYSTYLGGSDVDCEVTGDFGECDIAVDVLGSAYVTGLTSSTDYPTYQAYDASYNGTGDVYVTKLSPDGLSLSYSTYLGGAQGEQGFGITVDTAGSAYVTGRTSSSDFPTTDGAIDQTISGMDVFITKISTDGLTLSYSTFLGGSATDVGYEIAIDSGWTIYLAGVTGSNDFPLSTIAFDRTFNGAEDGFVSNIGTGVYNSQVPDESSQSGCGDGSSGGSGGKNGSDDSDDNVCEDTETANNTQGSAGDPINTRTGSFEYSAGYFSIPTSAGNLVFQYLYSSNATDTITTTMGYGWTHNLDTRLIFPNDPLGESGLVLFKAHTLNLHKFYDLGDGTYLPDYGVTYALTLYDDPPVMYKVTTKQQEVYYFDAAGKVLKWSDAQNHSWTYTYDGYGRLDQVTDDTGLRFLDLAYDGQGRVETVTDHTGRELAFFYDPAGDLSSVVDVLDQSWDFTYDNHRLRLVTNPAGEDVVHNEYDVNGRAVQQYDTGAIKVLDLNYLPDGTTIITDSLQNPRIHSYDVRNTLISDFGALDGERSTSYDINFHPREIQDENGNRTLFTWSNDQQNLEVVLDAEGAQTDLFYDSLNNLTSVIGPRGFLTTYSYSGTLMISSTDALSNTTYYSYTTSADAPQPPGLLKGVIDPLGHVTQFACNLFGQRTSTTDPNGVTYYEYDDSGRLIRTTYPSGRSDWTCYDAANRVMRSVFNASGDGGTPQTDPCDALNYQPSQDPKFDRISTTVYDLSDNMIAVIDPSGRITRTYYNTNNRPVVVVKNLVGQGIEVTTPPDYDPDYPDQNVRSETVYDANGNVIASIDPLGRITRTYYDALNRPATVTHNLVGQGIEGTTPPAYNPQYPDQNVSSQTVYDAAGNVIAAIDPEGIIVRTYYDAVNRPVTVVQNLVGQTIENPMPPTYDPNYPDRNLRTDTVYDENGNAIASIDTMGTIVRTYYDALNRPETTVQNLVGQAIEYPTPPSYNPAYPDRNLLTDYVYDPSGNLIATVDPAGSVTRTYFDQDNRPQVVVRNLYGQAIENPNPPAYDPDFPDRNVQTENVYDEYGRLIAAIDPLGHVTRTYYDSLDRPTVVVRNLSGQSIGETTPPAYNPAYPDQNVRTETVYGPDGEALATISNDGAITRTYYDRLDRVRYTVQNQVGQDIEVTTPPTYNPDYPDRNVRTETVYDAAGRAVRTIDTQGQVTHACYDGLGRGVKTVLNPTVGDPCGSYTPSAASDLDITTVTIFDAVGNRLSMIDPEGNETSFEYDGVYRLTAETDPLQHTIRYTYDGSGNRVSTTNARDIATRFEYDQVHRLTAVVENHRPGYGSDHETNVRTEYRYDAVGNRVSIRNARYQYTYFGYDGLNRLTGELDPLNHQTTYGYDASGNRVSLLDANGELTSFGYDGLDRPILIDYPSPDADVTFTYDAAGNRASMSDGLGTTGWAYDELNRALAVTDPFSQTVSYGYNGVGQRTSITYPDTRVVTYTLDNAGRLQLVTGWDSLTTTYTYEKNGRMGSAALPNGVTATYDFDEAGRLSELSYTSGGKTLSRYEYEYDDSGNRTRAIETVLQPEGVGPGHFADGFENGNMYAWTSFQAGGSDFRIIPPAAIVGSLGLEANVRPFDDVYVEKQHSPTSQYHARFYFDPNSATLNPGLYKTIFSCSDEDTNQRIYIQLLFSAGDYLLSAAILDDSYTTYRTPWVMLSDGPHAVEIEWNAASAIDAEDGDLTLWTDGVQRGQITNLDVDYRLAGGRLGVPYAGGIDSGTFYFDAFESNFDHYIGLDPDALPAPPLDKPDALFADGFESGDLSAWSSSTTDNGDLSVSPDAAMAGDQGLETVIDDNNSLYVTDWKPFDETRYRARFYFDPNGIGMANNNAFYLFSTYNRDNVEIARVELRYSVGDYQVRASLVNDGTTWSNTPWVTVADGVHALEIDWQAATAAGANNGGLTFWVDNVQTGSFNNIDNDTRKVDYVRLGGVSGIDSGTRGVYYIDAFDSHRQSYIGLDPAALPPEPLNKPDAIFSDGFESGNFSAWTLSTTDGGDLSVSAQAALVGSYGMKAVLDDNVSIYVTDWSPFDETRYRARFYFDPNTITMAANNAHYLFYALNRDNVVVARLELRRYNNTYQVRSGVVNDGSTWSNSAWFTLTDAPHKLEIDWRASSGPGANNGGITFWVDDVQRGNFTNIDNDTRKVDYVRLGGVAGIDSGTRGTYYFDDFVSRRQSYIGMLDIPSREVALEGPTEAGRPAGAAKVLAAPAPVHLPSPPVNLPHGEVAFAPLEQSQAISVTTVITYTYDPLDRLVGADYSDGRYVHYEYDAVGNRVYQELNGSTTDYYYDNANRLYQVINWEHGNYEYSWDNNGNLLDNGVYTYSYDHANRLVGVSGAGLTANYGYNGLGDRLRQTANSITTEYALDLAAGLTQVLDDETNAYLYGIGRIGEEQPDGWQYYLGDALGSVRQLTDEAGEITLAKSYLPYGEAISGAGGAASAYGYTNEYTSQGLIYLRARWYAPQYGRFLSKDIWPGDYTRPLSLNGWNYVEANPVNLTDPSGMAPDCDQYQRADLTQWLIDEMNENRRGYIFLILWTAVHVPEYNDLLFPGLPEFDLPTDLAYYGIAFGLFADVVKPGGLWDFKNAIREVVGRNIQLTDNWYRYDVPGNLYFGFIGLAAGFNEGILHCGADYATNGIPCSGSDSFEDYEAVEAGYDIYKQSKWRDVDEHMIDTALMKHPQIAAGQKAEPNLESYSIPWPYPVGTFDDGSSGWIIRHR